MTRTLHSIDYKAYENSFAHTPLTVDFFLSVYKNYVSTGQPHCQRLYKSRNVDCQSHARRHVCRSSKANESSRQE